MRAPREGAGAGESRRAHPGHGRGAVAGAPLAHRRRARRRARMDRRPVRWRAARRARVGPRRARHERSGRSERGGGRVTPAGGLAPTRRPRLHRRGRRGGRRRLRSRVARARAPGGLPRRLLDQRGRRRPGRARRAHAVPLRDRGEDERAVHAARARSQRARLDAGDRRQRARQGGAARGAAGRVRAEAAPRPGDGGASSLRSTTGALLRRRKPWHSPARSIRSRPSSWSHCSGRRSRRR